MTNGLIGAAPRSYKHGEDQLVVLPLRLPVKVYSGIAPPKALLDAALTGEAGKMESNNIAPSMGSSFPPGKPTVSHTPASSAAVPPPQFPYQGQLVQPMGGPQAPYDDAPPSYEDAIGQDLPPINGYRGSYQPPPMPEGAPRFSDEKRR